MWTKPGEAYTRSAALFTIPEFIAQYGVDPGPLLDEAGIAREAAANPNLFISFERHGRFVELAARRCGEPDFGLKHALYLPRNFPNSGPMMMLSHFCGSLGEWIELASRYSGAYSNGCKPFLFKSADGTATFRLLENPVQRMPRQMAEGLMTTIFFMVREITQPTDLALRCVRFHSAAPADRGLHQEIYRCPIEFGAWYNEFVFDAELLDIRLDGRLGLLRGVMDAYLKSQIRRIVPETATMAAVVGEAIPVVLGTPLCTAGHVAHSLGMSEKKMQRLLVDEGQSFRSVLQSVREKLAHTILRETNVPIDAIADFLGYASNAAFTRAFSAWAQCSPSAYRRERQARPVDLETPT